MLQAQDSFDLVFMDIMMPVMGGYEAMKIIREDLRMDSLPIIALTAKAMKGERDKCMEAGASDYIMKPLNIDQLFSLMRVWLTEQVNAH
jgi:two-component system chemotaxis sensor kinase CheA